MEGLFFEAAAALLHYQRERHDPDLAGPFSYTGASDEAQNRLMNVLGEHATEQDDLRLLLHERMLEEALLRGEIPREIRRGSIQMHAKGFLSALANLGKMLGKLEPAALAATATQAWDAALPELAEVRNSTQHPEDRVRGMGRARRGQDQPLQLKPISNSLIHAPSGALVLDSFRNDHFGTTIADGQYVEVEISDSTLSKARDVLELVFAQMSWEQFGRDADPHLQPEVVNWAKIRHEALMAQLALPDALASARKK